MRRRGPARMMAARMTVRRMHRRRRRRRRRRVLLVGGLVALGAYKLTKKDTERVEEHTGKKAEELTDEELEQAMKQLGIEGEEMSDEEMDYVDEADPPEEDYIEELERLGDLREKGIITDEEFEAKKQQLLGL
ncbi:MAG: SHOCT domain-containing protein [Chloroflexi bacterium]|nr:SHOCT domain-containing protein [Chloroflexota bacterium]